jgi:hypothetical protein
MKPKGTKSPTLYKYHGPGPLDIDLAAETAFRVEFARAFANWQGVESELFQIFQYLTCGKQPGTTAAVYGTIITFKGKLQATNAAAQFILPLKPALLEQWDKLKKQTEECVIRRNQLAHFDIQYVLNKAKKHQPILIPHPKPTEIDLTKAADCKRIADWSDSFLLLSSKLRAFNRDLRTSGILGQKTSSYQP